MHDKAPCMRAKASQHLLKENGVDFWGNDIWPENSPDLNAAEHIGAIIKDEVEAKMIKEHQGTLFRSIFCRNIGEFD